MRISGSEPMERVVAEGPHRSTDSRVRAEARSAHHEHAAILVTFSIGLARRAITLRQEILVGQLRGGGGQRIEFVILQRVCSSRL